MQTVELMTLIITLALFIEVTYALVWEPRRNVVKKHARSVLVDTSVLIDGRIVTVAKTGFIGGILYIPRSVIGELQYLADNADHEKRARARSGLDVVSTLQGMDNVDVEILQDGSHAEEGVDERLLKLAKKYDAAICTIDYNLNKVATVEKIQVLNVNELSQGVRMAYLPGEKLSIDLVQKGQDSHQGVGYLTDGTMVVVENSSNMIGSSVEVEFVRSLQTAAGRMMFARRVGAGAGAQAQQNVVRDKAVAPNGRKDSERGKSSQRRHHNTNADRAQSNDKPEGTQPTAQPVKTHMQAPTRRRNKQRSEESLIGLINKS